ncbi:hypothetical protein H7142_02255 [Candidatus Saccharibacteria bacterium]|nr:hypothetical protein [Candidatus Saccharibacteria bacterium]
MYSSSLDSSGSAEASALMFGVLGFVTILAYVVGAIFMGMIFKKAGIPAWKAWVPVYNSWIFLEMGDQQGWLSLLVLLAWIPLLGIIPAIVLAVFMCIAAYRIGLSFGKEGWFVLLYIFVGLAWLIWLAVDKTAVWRPLAQATGNSTEPPVAPAPTQQPPTM